jgi:phosphatidylserine/phosphatidylglycerophosphate/cardiolipin synthase-like enzyme
MRQAILILLLLSVCQAEALQVVEFCPDPWLSRDRDEYLVLEGHGLLDGFVISDGEGGFRFPSGTRIQGRLVVAREGESYFITHGNLPDFEWEDSGPRVPDVVRSGRFQMANTADELRIHSGGILLQSVEWPGTVEARQGQIHYFVGGDWDPRVLMLGQSRLDPATFTGVSGTAFVSPDCSREVFLTAVDRAESEILVGVYEFTSVALAGSLAEAKERGVDVRILLEGGPVGGISGEEKTVIARLSDAGIPICLMGTTEEVHSPYRFMHAKYMVIDRKEVLLTSENFKESGFPYQGTRGNRGWGVALSHPEIAGYFAGVFSLDTAGGWTTRGEGYYGDEEDASGVPYTSEFVPLSFDNATVTVAMAPDSSDLLPVYLESASRSLDIEAAYITNESPGVLNPMLSAAINASRRGIQVRILLDSYYYNVEGPEDNDEMVSIINGIARSEGIPVKARLADLSPGNPEKIHNKGAIVDEEKVLISSINWNRNSPTFNREAAVILEHPEVGRYYTSIFEEDWKNAERSIRGPETDPWKIIALLVVVTALLFLFLRKRKGE